jgi:heptosyltransferase-2
MQKKIPAQALSHIEKIVIIGAIGIGNLILFSGMLRRIRKIFPQARITILVLKESFKPLYENDSNVDEIIVLDVDKTKSLQDKLRFLFMVRRKRYDVCITTFPSNRIEYNVLAFLIGARYRIAHNYATKQLKTLSFLQNIRILVDTGLHDGEQNCNLLRAFGVEPSEEDKNLYISIGEEAHRIAQDYIKQRNLEEKMLIGMHPGSSAERGMHLKRWSIQNFALLNDWLFETYNAVILLFGGVEEAPLRQEIISLATHKPIAIEGLDFLSTAAIIGRCTLFISSDSGLMHVSSVMGVPTIALFGPTDPGRTRPYGAKHIVVRTGIDCSPCWSINNLGVGTVRCIHPENYCMTQLSVEIVKTAVSKILA